MVGSPSHEWGWPGVRSSCVGVPVTWDGGCEVWVRGGAWNRVTLSDPNMDPCGVEPPRLVCLSDLRYVPPGQVWERRKWVPRLVPLGQV